MMAVMEAAAYALRRCQWPPSAPLYLADIGLCPSNLLKRPLGRLWPTRQTKRERRQERERERESARARERASEVCVCVCVREREVR
jgi:hypothetical protein